MKTVFRRELGVLAHSAFAFIACACLPLGFAWSIYKVLLTGGVNDIHMIVSGGVYGFAPVLLLYACHGYGSDRRGGADRLWSMLPVSRVGLALGRYLAYLVPVLAGVALCGAEMLALNIAVSMPAVYCLMGLLLMALCGCFVTALGLFLSSVSRNIPVELLLAAACCALMVFGMDIAKAVAASPLCLLFLLLVIAAFAILVGWKAVHSVYGALIAGLACELVALLVLRGSASAQRGFAAALGRFFCAACRFDCYAAGILSFADIAWFVLVTAVLLLPLCLPRGRRAAHE